MAEIPPEFEEIVANPNVQKAITEQPGSDRFHATALGLAALKYLKDQQTQEADHPDLPRNEP